MKLFKRSWWKAYERARVIAPFHDGRSMPKPHHSCERPQPTLLANPADVKLGNGLRLSFPRNHWS